MLFFLCLTVAACGQTSSDPTPPPGTYTLQGTLHAPTGENVAGSVVVACYAIGDSCDETRSGSYEVSASGPSASFEITDLQNTAYELFAVKDTDGDGAYSENDLYGELGAPVTPPQRGLELRLARIDDGGDPVDPGDPSDPTKTHRFFLFSGSEVRTTTHPRIETDQAGGVHMVFPAHAVGDAFYAYCPADCSSLAKASVVKLATDGTVDNAMLALDSTGTPHVLLSSYQRVYYASCGGDCRQESAWRVDSILEHDGAFEVSGEAFALDPQDRPRFLMHPYRSLSPIGNPDPAAFLVTCDASCTQAANWSRHQVSTQTWQEASLRYDASGTPHVSATVTIDGVGDAVAYFTCSADCTVHADNWQGVGLLRAYSDPYVSQVRPVVSLALTRDGRPRMLALGEDDTAGRVLVYFECDTACTSNANWLLNALVDGDAASEIGPGLDLALDAADRPRLAYTADYNILMASCDQNCGQGGWQLTPVELSADLPADEAIPYHNCTVSAWFLRQPSIALGLDGRARVAYRAEDISGSYGPIDPNHPPCSTGADMTLTRFAQLGAP